MNLTHRFLLTGCSLSLLLNTNTRSALSVPAFQHNSPRAISTEPLGGGLRKPDRARLAEARAEGKSEITVLIAAMPGKHGLLANKIASLGGRVRFRADEVGYLRARIPIDHVEAIARSSEVQTINIDGGVIYETTIDNDEPDHESMIRAQAEPLRAEDRISPPDRNTPAENPYLPTREIGAPQFMAAHPTFDGRGVTIGIIDGFPDLLSPELQTATTLEGKPTRKIIDLLSTSDPIDDDSPTLVKMDHQVTASSNRFNHKGVVYTVPVPGSYRIGFLNERVFRYYNNDLNFDGNPEGSSGLFAMLWDEHSNTVWVDTNQNHDFTDDQAMTDYKVRFDFSIFGKDDPTTPRRESLPFAVQTIPEVRGVRVMVLASRHATSVAGIASGKRFFGGQLNGVAPEAQVVAISPSANTHGLMEAIILAARHTEIDVMIVEFRFHVSINDGGSIIGVICNRLTEYYNKPIFSPADNIGPGLNTVGENGNASRVISVGAYTHRDTWRALYARAVPKEHYVDVYSARGPGEDGSFKPDLIAPSSTISVNPAVFPSRVYNDMYKLPHGYTPFGGTSGAAPMAAGAAALLISAAKQSGISYTAEQVQWALKSGARFLPGIGAHDQGAGLINIPAAWGTLNQASAFVAITSRCPVNTVLSNYLIEPHQGPGIYEREGWSARQTGNRVITFTRTTGSPRPIKYLIEWTGNDGTFVSPSTVALPLNHPVKLAVTITPKASGVHSAILKLIDPETSLIVHQMMNTVVAAEQLTASNGYMISLRGRADWLGYTSYFINVPPTAAALKIDAKVEIGKVDIRLFDPAGEDAESDRPRPPGIKSTGLEEISGPWSRTLSAPIPGVWQVLIKYWDNTSRDAVLTTRPAASFALTAVALGVAVSPSVLTISSAQVKENPAIKVKLSNRLSSFTGSIIDSPIGSAFSDRPALLAGGPQRIYELNVEPGTRILRAQISGTSDRNADLDLYMFDCTGGKPVLRGFSAERNSHERVTLNNPAAGKWLVVIDPFRIPSGKTDVEYQDIFTHPSYGMINSADAPVKHSGGHLWEGSFNVQIGKKPSVYRYPAGLIDVVGETEDVVGSNFTPVNPRSLSDGVSFTPVRGRVSLGTAVVEIKTGEAAQIGQR
jgi:hypothetical protein